MYGNYYLNILGFSIFSVHILLLCIYYYDALIVDSPAAKLVILLCSVYITESIPKTITAARYATKMLWNLYRL